VRACSLSYPACIGHASCYTGYVYLWSPWLYHYLTNGTNLVETIAELKMCFLDFLHNVCLNFFILRRTERDIINGPYWWPRGLRRGSAATRLLEIVGSNLDGARLSFSCECCVLCTGLCVRLITRPEGSYWVRCVWVWSWSLDSKEADDPWNKISEMYTSFHVKCPLFLLGFIESCIFRQIFGKILR